MERTINPPSTRYLRNLTCQYDKTDYKMERKIEINRNDSQEPGSYQGHYAKKSCVTKRFFGVLFISISKLKKRIRQEEYINNITLL